VNRRIYCIYRVRITGRFSVQSAVEMAARVNEEADKASKETTNLTSAAEELDLLAQQGQEAMRNLVARTEEQILLKPLLLYQKKVLPAPRS
jgi:hypothetical protein